MYDVYIHHGVFYRVVTTLCYTLLINANSSQFILYASFFDSCIPQFKLSFILCVKQFLDFFMISSI